MPELRKLRPLAVIAGLLASSTAMAFPWDIDLVDAYFYRGYEWKMMDVPEGAVSRNQYFENADRMTPEGQALTNPYSAEQIARADGERMFNVYCATCHGKEGLGGAPVADNTSGKRYPVLPPNLAGEATTVKARSDGYLYLTIRNGGALMPAYGSALNDDEMWAIVSYIRTLPGTAYIGN
jgi:mono/diheme cytochrome c family protein